MDILSAFDPTRISNLLSQLTAQKCRTYTSQVKAIALRSSGKLFEASEIKWIDGGGNGSAIVHYKNLEAKPVQLELLLASKKVVNLGLELPSHLMPDQKKSTITLSPKQEGAWVLDLSKVQDMALSVARHRGCGWALKDLIRFESKTTFRAWIPKPTGGPGQFGVNITVLERHPQACGDAAGAAAFPAAAGVQRQPSARASPTTGK